MKLLGSTKSKTTKNKNGENVNYLEITQVVLMYCNIVNNDYLQDSRVLYTFVLNESFAQLSNISPKNSIFLILKIIFFTQNFHILKYGLLIKTLNHYR